MTDSTQLQRRSEEIASDFSLPAAVAPTLLRLSRLLSEQAAPTASTDPLETLDVHVADSLSGLQIAALGRPGRIADVGSGAGLPALPLAISLPGSEIEPIEATGRKAAFIASAADTLGLTNIRTVAERAEIWAAADGRERYELTTVRAVAELAVLLEYAAPLLVEGGAMIAWKGRRDPKEESAAAVAAGELGMELESVVSVQPYPASRDRHLHVYRKTGAVPARFPRRPGAAARKPLGR